MGSISVCLFMFSFEMQWIGVIQTHVKITTETWTEINKVNKQMSSGVTMDNDDCHNSLDNSFMAAILLIIFKSTSW